MVSWLGCNSDSLIQNPGFHSISREIYYEFNVQGSVHRKYIPFDIYPTRCNITQFIYFWKTGLHVSDGISAHHQEHTQLYLSVNKVMCTPDDGWRYHPKHVEQFSRNK